MCSCSAALWAKLFSVEVRLHAQSFTACACRVRSARREKTGMAKMFEIITFRSDKQNMGQISGPFKTHEVAERALVSLFQSGQAVEGKIRSVEVNEETLQAS